MQTPKLKLALVLLMIPAFAASIFAQSQDASETVKSFYKFHNTRSGIFSLHELKLHKRWLTAELYKLLLNELRREDEFVKKNPDEKPHFGDGFPFQPFSECVIAEKVISNLYEVREISSDEKNAVVEIKFYMPDKCEKEFIDAYRVELLRVRNVWLINDWIFADGSRLTDDLKRKDY